MSDEQNNGGPAFPRPIGNCGEYVGSGGAKYSEPQTGMSLCDWFAGQALVGCTSQTPEAASKLAFDYAAAMIAERVNRG